jgi:hypothetical protein
MLKKHPVLAILLIFVLTAVACNFPTAAAGTATPEGPQATFTALAQTLEVALTQTASASGTGTPTATSAAATVPPTNTAIARPTNTSVQPTQVPCNWVRFVSDVTVDDDTLFNANDSFVKTWRLQNAGSCTWSTGYAVVFDSGDQMSAPNSVNLPQSVAPGATIDVSVPMKAPANAGTYKGFWKMSTANGVPFGIGNNANSPFWVQIKVQVPTATGPTVVYNFSDHMCDAGWTSAAGILTCPSASVTDAGYVAKLDNPRMETGDRTGTAAIETIPLQDTHPQWAAEGNGWIQGAFPAVNIKPGYRFRAQIGCLDGANTCDVKFYLKYSADGGAWASLGPAGGWAETYDNSIRTLDIDLAALSGKSVEFLFQVDANSNAGQDYAVWVNPRLEKSP